MYKYITEELRLTLLLVNASRALKATAELLWYFTSYASSTEHREVSPPRELVDSLKNKNKKGIHHCHARLQPNREAKWVAFVIPDS